MKLEWHLIDWGSFPFVTSLGAWFEQDNLYVVRSGSYRDLGVGPYCGPEMNRENARLHNWERYVHLWVKDLQKVIEIEERLHSSMAISIFGEG